MSATEAQKPDLLISIIEAHGGLERWNRINKIEITWNFYGAVLELKGYPGTRHPIITIPTHGPPSSIITNLHGDPSDIWKFSPGHNSIIKANGEVISERSNPRAAFAGHTHLTPWDELHLLYFVGYAFYNYLTTPFIFVLPGFQTRELDSWSEASETWRVLEVTYPDGFPTHTKIQRFYFNSKDFMLRRIDYEPDVAGGVACHYCYDYKSFGGIVIPTLRRVVKRVMPERRALLQGPTVFGLQYAEVKIFDEDGSVHSEGKRVNTVTE